MATQQQIQEQEQKEREGYLVTGIQAGQQSLVALFAPSGGSIPGGLLATVIETIGSAAIAGVQYFVSKDRQKRIERMQKEEKVISTYVDRVLSDLDQTGRLLIDNNLVPDTEGFEAALKKALYRSIGYCGYCNIDMWSPPPLKNFKYKAHDRNSKTYEGPIMGEDEGDARIQTLKALGLQGAIGIKIESITEVPGPPPMPRFLWFKMENGGQKLTSNNPALRIPQNLPSYWASRCSNIRDGWVSYFKQKLIREGRTRELQFYQKSILQGDRMIQIAFGGTAILILLAMVFMTARKKTPTK